MDSLTSFAQDARMTGRGLQMFTAKVAGAVDLFVSCSSDIVVLLTKFLKNHCDQ